MSMQRKPLQTSSSRDRTLAQPRVFFFGSRAHPSGAAMEDVERNEATPLSWSAARSAKDRSAVTRSVSALLDMLAPEQTLTRAEREREPIEKNRTPTGCVLQGPTAALSVSWFADGANEKGFGELHVLVWNGVVARRGTHAPKQGATVVETLVLHPDETRIGEGFWRASEDVVFDTLRLATHCQELLEKQLAQ
jgi:hypothetical protein